MHAFTRAHQPISDWSETLPNTGDKLLTPGEVALMFRVDPKTVTRWAAAGKIPSVRTLGGHRRFWHSDVLTLLSRDGTRHIDDDDEHGGGTR